MLYNNVLSRKRRQFERMKLFVSCPRGRTFDSFFDSENVELAQTLFDVVWNPFDRNVTQEEVVVLEVEG